MSSKGNERIYKCPKCDTFCIKNIKKFPSGKVLHMACGTEVEDVTEKIDQSNRVPSGPYD